MVFQFYANILTFFNLHALFTFHFSFFTLFDVFLQKLCTALRAGFKFQVSSFRFGYAELKVQESY